jgi:glycosyltransferase A (GT-A) superfamily protein (DUF2064 family)
MLAFTQPHGERVQNTHEGRIELLLPKPCVLACLIGEKIAHKGGVVQSFTASQLQEISREVLSSGVEPLSSPPTSCIGAHQFIESFSVVLKGVLASPMPAQLPLSSSKFLCWGMDSLFAGLAARSNYFREGLLQHKSTPLDRCSKLACTVCVVAKVPREGQSKTRLAMSIPPAVLSGAAALSFVHRFAEASLMDTLQKFHDAQDVNLVWALPSPAASAVQSHDAASALLQTHSLLGVRLLVATNGTASSSEDESSASAEASVALCPCLPQAVLAPSSLGTMLSSTCAQLGTHSACPLVLVGMDTPHIALLMVRTAAAASNVHRCAVAIPSTDGGFVCLALLPAHIAANSHSCGRLGGVWRSGALFDAVGAAQQWSTPGALAAQVQALVAAGVPLLLLGEGGGLVAADGAGPPLHYGADGVVDIDTWEDMKACYGRCTKCAAPRTRTVLDELLQTQHTQPPPDSTVRQTTPP